MSSATASTSDTMWVDRITMRSPASVPSRLRKRSRSSGSSPTVGSSTISTAGSFSSAWAIPTRWRIPPEYFPSGRRPTSVRLTSASSSATRALAVLAVSPLTAAR